MAYGINLNVTDLGARIRLGIGVSGVFTNTGPFFATDTATGSAASPTAPTTLRFAAAIPPPPGVATLLISDAAPSGDLFRSGQLTVFPLSPATVEVIGFPLITVPESTLTTAIAGVLPIVLAPPGWLIALIGFLSVGMFIPMRGAITGLTPTVGSPPGAVSFTVTGSFAVLVAFTTVQSISFTGTLVATPAPSGDVTDRGRVLSVPCGTTLTVISIGLDFGLMIMSLFLTRMGPMAGLIARPFVETAINGLITGLVAPSLAMLGSRPTSTSVVSARSVTITSPAPPVTPGGPVTPGTIVLALVIADLFGKALEVIVIPKDFHATVAPQPVAGAQRMYRITVTDAATGHPVDQAAVTLHNFTTNGDPVTVALGSTDSSGQVPCNEVLRPKITYRIAVGDHERLPVFASPILTVTKGGFNSLTVRLLKP